MVGFYATADSSAPIRTDLDNELEGQSSSVDTLVVVTHGYTLDARWYTREEVLAVLRHRSGTNFSRRDYKNMAAIQDGPDVSADANKAQAGTAALAHSDPSIKAKEAAMTKPQEQSVLVDKDDEPPFRMPPSTAIAGVLIQHWAEGKTLGNANLLPTKGNL
jgi:NAD+ diphosphatase